VNSDFSFLNKIFPNEMENEKKGLADDFSRLVKKILGKAHWNIKSIIIYGSAATGEHASIPNDIDVIVVSKIYDPLLFQRIAPAINLSKFEIEVDQISLNDFLLLKTRQLADVKNSGVVIYGDKSILFGTRTDDIYYYEGIKSLFNFGVMKPLSAVSKNVLTSDKLSSERTNLILNSCVKAYEGICACLLILRKQYKLGYGARAHYFSETYEEEFPSLYKEIDNLGKKVELAYDLRINKRHYYGNVIDFWFDTRRDVGTVIPFAMAEFFGRATVSPLLSSVFLLNSLPHDFLSSLMYTVRLLSGKMKVPPPSIFSIDPVSKLYISCSCLLFSFDSKLNFKEDFMEIAEKNLRSILPLSLKSMSQIEKWEEMRKTSVSLNSIVSQWHTDKIDPCLFNL